MTIILKKGYLLVIEGTDGSGKGTQLEKLASRFREMGHDIAVYDFPQYGTPHAHFVEQYLNGEYGDAQELGPYLPSYFYALDRYAVSKDIQADLDKGRLVLCNRYTTSNLAHQGGKFQSKEDRSKFFEWVSRLEYESFGIPKPDKTILLRVPVATSQENVDKKEKRPYIDGARDIHEDDANHLAGANDTYSQLVLEYPGHYIDIDCMSAEGKMLPIDTITDTIFKQIKKEIPALTLNSSAENETEQQDAFTVKIASGAQVLTEAGKQEISKYVSDPTKDVYSFFQNGEHSLSAVTVAAGMARLSRRADDMRVTILDEFIGNEGSEDGLIERVVTAYGDDSVQQLVGMHLVVENASNLLTKKLEWGRLAAYLEQSTRYIYFDKKDNNGKYKYVVPANLASKIRKKYVKTMDHIFDEYSSIVKQLTEYVRSNSSVSESDRDGAFKAATRAQACDAARALLPVATKSTVGIYASGQALENLIMNLQSDSLEEARRTGEQLLEHGRKVMPVFLQRADKPNRGGATVAYKAETRDGVQRLSEKYLKEPLASAEGVSARLIRVSHANELDIVPDILFEHSQLGRQEIESQVKNWPITKKTEVFNAFIGQRLNRRHRPGRALEQIHYQFEVVCDYGIFRDLQRHRMVDDLNWQELTPRYGYEIPELIEEAGLAERFSKVFDKSFMLYGEMQMAGNYLEAQYATLMGHKMRWKITYNARQAFHLHELRTTPHGHPGYRKLVNEMHQHVSKVHPRIAAAMKFVNSDEDPELSRLAAERATQFKLRQLES